MSIPAAAFEEIRTVCRDAWQRGLLSGFNGNVSLRLDAESCAITCSGAAKGHLRPADVAIVGIAQGKTLEGGKASSELAMHLEIYRHCPHTQGIVHTHPRHLLALGLRLPESEFLAMPLFEAAAQRARMSFAPALSPGTSALAQAVGQAACQTEAVWMAQHGLCCHGTSLIHALALTEELEHLAAVQLLSLPS
ncbi:MAG: class II aldolase/adducin family protein [Desulfovibrionaceae bacterium]|nr:class II aldolase/adducin family protein [Desulfovibrionaceae bacterium]